MIDDVPDVHHRGRAQPPVSSRRTDLLVRDPERVEASRQSRLGQERKLLQAMSVRDGKHAHAGAEQARKPGSVRRAEVAFLHDTQCSFLAAAAAQIRMHVGGSTTAASGRSTRTSFLASRNEYCMRIYLHHLKSASTPLPPCMFGPDRRGKVRLPLKQPDRTVQPGNALGRRTCSQARI